MRESFQRGSKSSFYYHFSADFFHSQASLRDVLHVRLQTTHLMIFIEKQAKQNTRKKNTLHYHCKRRRNLYNKVLIFN